MPQRRNLWLSRKSAFTVRWQGGDGPSACRELCTFSPFNNRESGTTGLWATLACVVIGLSGRHREKQSSSIQQAKLLKTMKSVHLRHYLCFAYFIFWSLKLFHVSPIHDNLRCCSAVFWPTQQHTEAHLVRKNLSAPYPSKNVYADMHSGGTRHDALCSTFW